MLIITRKCKERVLIQEAGRAPVFLEFVAVSDGQARLLTYSDDETTVEFVFDDRQPNVPAPTRRDERVLYGDDVVLIGRKVRMVFIGAGRGSVRVGFDAPREVLIDREEIFTKKQEAKHVQVP